MKPQLVVGAIIEVLTVEKGWRPATVDELYVGGFWVTYEGGRTCFFDGDNGWRWPSKVKVKVKKTQENDAVRHLKLIGEQIEEGGWFYGKWLSQAQARLAEKRWHARGQQHVDQDDGQPQCGGCRYFGALNADWGLCLNPKSQMDGMAVFEHNGCNRHSSAAAHRRQTPRHK